jgi:hypothetical protein
MPEFTNVAVVAAEEPGSELKQIRVVACGEEFSVFVCEDNTVFSCGLGIAGQLGLGESMTDVKVPQEIRGLRGKGIELLNCSKCQSFALSRDGDLFAWGTDPANLSLAQLNPDIAVFEPQKLKNVGKKNVRRIECGRVHWVMVSNATHPSYCTVDVPPKVRAGARKNTLRIFAFDSNGQPQSRGGDIFSATWVYRGSLGSAGGSGGYTGAVLLSSETRCCTDVSF